MPPALGRAHERRLRAVYRSAGWPCLDPIEVDLLAAGLLERIAPTNGSAEYLRLTDAGLRHLAEALGRNRAVLDAHEALVKRVADELVTEAGRIAFCGLTLLAKPGEEWLHLKPDVFSIRNTTVEDYLEPVVHEIKVKRSDLKSDLNKPFKRAGYIALASECYYVLGEGVGRAEDIPPECGVLIATASRMELARPAPRRAMKLGFGNWMALAKATRHRQDGEREPLL